MNCGSSPSVDDRFTAFADSSRRTILSTLCERSSRGASPAAGIETLTAELAAGGRDERDGRADGGRVPGDRNPTTEAQVELVHVHLPALERAGLAERDGERVRLTEDSAVVERGLELAETFR